jgi:hypothetical protein
MRGMRGQDWAAQGAPAAHLGRILLKKHIKLKKKLDFMVFLS